MKFKGVFYTGFTMCSQVHPWYLSKKSARERWLLQTTPRPCPSTRSDVCSLQVQTQVTSPPQAWQTLAVGYVTTLLYLQIIKIKQWLDTEVIRLWWCNPGAVTERQTYQETRDGDAMQKWPYGVLTQWFTVWGGSLELSDGCLCCPHVITQVKDLTTIINANV